MLTCLASESTSLTFLTFPLQLLRMGQRGARLWFHCTWPAASAPAAAAPAPGDSLQHWHGWKTPTSPTWSNALPPAWKGGLSVGA